MKDPPVCYLGDRSFEDAYGVAYGDKRKNEAVASMEGAEEGADADDGASSAVDSAVSVTPDSLPEPGRRPIPSVDRYGLDPDPGHCEAAITKYYYDRARKECREFMWGGCGGVVPFETRDECEAGLHLIDS